MEQDKTDILKQIQLLEEEIQNSKLLKSTKSNNSLRSIEIDEKDEKFLSIQEKKIKLAGLIEELKEKLVENENTIEMLNEDKLVQENEIINLISKKETFEEIYKFYQISSIDNDGSLVYNFATNKSMDFNEIKFDFFSCEFHILDKTKLTNILVSYINENLQKEIITSKQLSDILSEFIEKVINSNDNDNEFEEYFTILGKRILGIMTASDKKLIQTKKITTEKITILIKVIFKMHYYEEIINNKLNFINKEYRHVKKEKASLESKLRNDLLSLTNKFDKTLKKEEVLKKHQNKKQNEITDSNKKNNNDFIQKLESKFQTLINCKGELDVEIASSKEKYFDIIENLDLEINKLEELNSQINSEIEMIFNSYEKTREDINYQISERKKFVTESYQSIREVTIQNRTLVDHENQHKFQKKENLMKDSHEKELNSNLKIEELCSELNYELEKQNSLTEFNKNEEKNRNSNSKVVCRETPLPNQYKRKNNTKITKNSNKKEKSKEKKRKNSELNFNYEAEKEYKEDSPLKDRSNTIKLYKQSSSTRRTSPGVRKDEIKKSKYNSNKISNETSNLVCPRPFKTLTNKQTENSPFKNTSFNIVKEKTNKEGNDIYNCNNKIILSKRDISHDSSRKLVKNKLMSQTRFNSNNNDILFINDDIYHTPKEDHSTDLNKNHMNTYIDKNTFNIIDSEINFLDNCNNEIENELKKPSITESGYKYNNTYNLNNLKTCIVSSVYNQKNQEFSNKKTGLNIITKNNEKDDMVNTKNSKLKSFSKEKKIHSFEKDYKEEKPINGKDNKFKFSVKFKFEICSPEEFQFLEKIRIVLEGSFMFKRINFLTNQEQNDFNPLNEAFPENSGFTKFFVYADKTLCKLNFEKLTEPSIKSEINISSINRVLVTKVMKNIVNYQQLLTKTRRKGIDINKYVSSMKNLEEIDIDYKFIMNEVFRKRCEEVNLYVLNLILNNGIRIELILSSYDDFKHWLNALTSIVKHKNKLPLLAGKIEQENNIYF